MKRRGDGKVGPIPSLAKQPPRLTYRLVDGLQGPAGCELVPGCDIGCKLKVRRTAGAGPNYVVRVYDAAYNPLTHEVRIYTELLEGGDLHKLPNRIYTSQTERRIHPLYVYHVALQLAWGLAEIQARTILHRDIKTDNVLMIMKITSEMNQGLWQLYERKALDARVEAEVIRYCDALYQRDDRLCVLTDFRLSRNETDQEGSTYTIPWHWGRSGRWGPAPRSCSSTTISHPWPTYTASGSSSTSCVRARLPPPAGSRFPCLPIFYSSSPQQIIDGCLSWDPLRRPTAGSMVQRLWALKTAECERMNRRFGEQKQYKRYLAEYEQERRRKEEIECRARERDQQAEAERQQAIAAWNAHLAQQGAAEAVQAPARGKLTKKQRAKYIVQSNRRRAYLNA